MKSFKAIALIIAALSVFSCGQVQRIMDGTEKLPSQIEKTNEEITKTNNSVRKQTIEVSLSKMKEQSYRLSLRPIPFDMLEFGKVAAESLTADEALLITKKTLKKINEERVEDRYPRVDTAAANYQDIVNALDDDKLADLMMITLISGFLPDSTLNQMIAQEAEQGAYRDVVFQILMMRVNFSSDLMLNASVMDKKLETLGKISKAIEYNSKVDFIAKLPFADQISLDITGFSVEAMNKGISQKLNTGLALKNWNRIYSAAQQDFKAMSFASTETEKNAAKASQHAEYSRLLTSLQGYIQAWGQAPAPLK